MGSSYFWGHTVAERMWKVRPQGQATRSRTFAKNLGGSSFNLSRDERRLYTCKIGDFNVSSLMGIKRRMIDIGKKITFYFLQNVWKCTVFFAFAFKVCKKCYYDPKIFFRNKYQCGYIKKPRILCWFQIRWCRLKQMPQKKQGPKNHANFEYLRFCGIFRGFLLLTFVRGISESRHQRIWNQHKILGFLIPILIFLTKRFFGVILALFAYFKCKCEKTVHFLTFCKR